MSRNVLVFGGLLSVASVLGLLGLGMPGLFGATEGACNVEGFKCSAASTKCGNTEFWSNSKPPKSGCDPTACTNNRDDGNGCAYCSATTVGSVNWCTYTGKTGPTGDNCFKLGTQKLIACGTVNEYNCLGVAAAACCGGTPPAGPPVSATTTACQLLTCIK
jgi:hypothetical protein